MARSIRAAPAERILMKARSVTKAPARVRRKSKPAKRIAIMTESEAIANPRASAKSNLSPSVGAANTIYTWLRTWNREPEDPDQKGLAVVSLAQELLDHSKDLQSGDMRRPEAMLSGQAHTLDKLFNVLASRAALNVAEYPDAADMYLKLALRAQSQCRATLETLSLLKNPPSIAFVRQANVANGPQQVNNGVQAEPPAECSRAPARETPNRPNKLLEQQSGERLDVRTPQAAVGSDPTMAALAEIHRTANTRGEKPRES